MTSTYVHYPRCRISPTSSPQGCRANWTSKPVISDIHLHGPSPIGINNPLNHPGGQSATRTKKLESYPNAFFRGNRPKLVRKVEVEHPLDLPSSCIVWKMPLSSINAQRWLRRLIRSAVSCLTANLKAFAFLLSNMSLSGMSHRECGWIGSEIRLETSRSRLSHVVSGHRLRGTSQCWWKRTVEDQATCWSLQQDRTRKPRKRM